MFKVSKGAYTVINLAVAMLLRYYKNEKGERVYTLSGTNNEGEATLSAHPAKFSPDDLYSSQRIACKKRFGLLPTQRKNN
ncbi:hypothetical protein RS030_3399 [Cryptosporidium xiaoi]|uniref:Nucleolar protein 10 n=1 Tax=Cryptosporidium xiaoi TaxID=659607 RepID=A0AAV9Y1Z7_9CRYT